MFLTDKIFNIITGNSIQQGLNWVYIKGAN